MKKHAFHCEKCEAECMIYRKGKAHRVLVCPNCGVLATNGKKGIVKKVGKRALKGVLGEIPGASLVMEGLGAVGDIKKGLKTSKDTTSPKQFIKTDSADLPNRGERVINKVLYGE